ncbi:conserved hypothetical protein [Scheffersomyces stipitis CBS 6054]|uniref:VASt domain-containing protein n=1 Tax=Scheffersomyces stipitis (strain ATCC 58785 / CBS 6054 / NBRC 10063 / NRRL Y-11545) TaxID=322104 RepID=A3LUW6_PICST|nr:conserved hypothetical protein [Scheffersomyces stipitis CBS 6054]ABN66668.2 conserved hypothetical protein [Scheffersomyces stipitis CBS 6054]
MDIDDDDDAWSYSFPPSTESLVLPANSSTSRANNSNGGSYSNPNSKTKLNSNSENSTVQPNSTREGSQDSQEPPGFVQKASPANPQATIEDAESFISKKSESSNALFEETLQSHNSTTPLDNDILKSPKSADDAEVPSPKVIAYRKSKRVLSEGNFDSIMESPPELKEKFDSRLYLDEFFKDTQYRYATMKRNTDFHQLFHSLDLTDRLVDDFSCALSREILLQGRLYVSENNICFNSNLLGWVTNLVIPMEEITHFEKRATAGLFPNGITIETAEAKHVFASFLSRDQTFEFMKTIREETTGRPLESEDSANEKVGQALVVRENDQSSEIQYSEMGEESPGISSYIMSIDGDDEVEDMDEDDEDDEDNEGSIETSKTFASSKRKSIPSGDGLRVKVLKFKDDSNYKNMGPDTHAPTEEKSVERDKEEKELFEEIIDAPLGVVFEILFGSNTTFHRRFLETHDGSELSQYDKFHPSEDDPTKLERTYTYRRALEYSIGPKSTMCVVSETIEHLNFADYIVVVTNTATPDVPSGNSFSVRTRYVMTWGPQNKTNLRISYYIHWTARSWIKGVIERSSHSGQFAFFKDLLVDLKQEIKSTTYYPVVPKVKKAKIKPVEKKFSYNEFIRNNIVSVCYLILSFFIIVLFLQLRMFMVINETNELIKNHLVINTRLVYVAEQQQGQLWDWVKKKYGKELSPIEKIEYLTYQIGALYQDKDESSSPFARFEERIQDIKSSVKEFNYEDYLNVEGVKSAIENLI